MNINSTSPVERLAYSILEAVAATRLGRSTLYIAIKEGRLKTIKIGKRRLIPVEALTAFLGESSE